MERFHNPYQKETKRGLSHFIQWQLGFYNDLVPLSTVPSGFVFPNPQKTLDETQPTVTWINHSTFWIKLEGRGILTDPIWNARCSPLSFLGPKRRYSPPLSIEQIDPLDTVIISHNHYDHLDRKTIMAILKKNPEVTWIVPKGVKRWFERHFPSISQKKLVELSWWEKFHLEGFEVTSVPAQHFSGRGILDSNKSLWMGCVVKSAKSSKSFYFVGDTGYNPFDFKEIGNKLGAFDLSLIPIGVYSPRTFMKPVHVNPDESVVIHQEVCSKLSVGGHWGNFRLSTESFNHPPYDLFCALERRGISPEQFRVLDPGQAINW